MNFYQLTKNKMEFPINFCQLNKNSRATFPTSHMLFVLAITFSFASLDRESDPLEGDKSHQFPFTKILSL